MFRTAVMATIVAIGVGSGAFAQTSKPRVPDEKLQETLEEANSLVKRFTEAKGCDETAAVRVKLDLLIFQDSMARDLEVARNDYSSKVRAEMTANVIKRLSFEIADTALEKECLKVSKEFYRRVIEIFVGSAYAADRQRAQIGLEDIRTKESTWSYKIKDLFGRAE